MPGITDDGSVLIKCHLCKKATATALEYSKIFKCDDFQYGCGGEFTFKEYDDSGNYIHHNYREKHIIILKKSKQK